MTIFNTIMAGILLVVCMYVSVIIVNILTKTVLCENIPLFLISCMVGAGYWALMMQTMDIQPV